MSEIAQREEAPSLPSSRYRVIARLGQGGMADVFLAQMSGPSGFSKLAVVKRIRADALAEDEAQLHSLFLDEARLAARLNHPNVISTFEVGEDIDGEFIAMEFLDGQPLNVILSRLKKLETPLDLGLHLHVINDVLTALDYAHNLLDYDRTPLHIVHRDVSPQNIFILYSGQTKLVDFGVAKAASASQHTRAGVLKGKVKYMAPEQAKAQSVDQRADVFAAGILMWEALAQRRMWAGMTEHELLMKLVTAQSVPSPRSVVADIPEALERVCMKALAFDLAARYPTASAFQTDLEAAIGELNLLRSQRDVARVVEDAFAPDRKVLHDVIEKFTRNPPAASPSAASLPVISQHLSTSELRSGSGDRSIPRTSLSGSGSSSSSSSTGSNSNSSVAGRETVADATLAETSLRPAPRKTSSNVVIVGVAAMASLAFVAWRFGHSPAPSPVTNVPISTAPVPPPPTTAVAPAATADDISVEVRAEPSSAALSIDDVPVSNPYKVRHSKDDGIHTLSVSAPGFQSSTMKLSFAHDVFVDVPLSKVPDAPAAYPYRPGRASAKTSAPADPAPPAAAPTPTPQRPADPPRNQPAPTVTLDPGNPFK